ncbi:MAG: hypothetical protein HKO53_03520 [Gemmatimonadetes bacterium]|nr:hypothetical protein [Gemmatimonadota bacterium]
MSLRTVFPPRDVAELMRMRTRAQERARLPSGLSPGWHSDLVDPVQVIEAFDLWLRDDVHARTHHHVSTEGVRGVVWVCSGRLDPSVEPPPWSGREDPPRPANWVEPMEAVGFAPGAWSFLCASVLVRELDELGHTGAFARWSKRELCDGSLPVPVGIDFWDADPPADLRPEVIEDSIGTTVRFHTFRRDPLVVYRHEDRFTEDDLAASSRERIVGRAQREGSDRS